MHVSEGFAELALNAAELQFPCKESFELHLNADGNESVIVPNLLQSVFKMGRPALIHDCEQITAFHKADKKPSQPPRNIHAFN